jgi:GxxExxY protein
MASKLIYKELSYKVVGAIYDAYNNLSGDYHEKYYQRAIAKFLEKRGVGYQREFPVDLIVETSKIGHHFVDFLIEGKIILEIKRGDSIHLRDIKQVLMYLKSANLQLGLLAYFGSNGVKIKRLVNKHYQS